MSRHSPCCSQSGMSMGVATPRAITPTDSRVPCGVLPESFDALVPLGWDDRVAALYASVAEPHHQPGRVGRVDRDRCSVRTVDGQVRATADVLPITGDWVVLGANPAPPVDAVPPRWPAPERRGP